MLSEKRERVCKEMGRVLVVNVKQEQKGEKINGQK